MSYRYLQPEKYKEILSKPDGCKIMRPIWSKYFYEEVDLNERNSDFLGIKNEFVRIVMELIHDGKEFVSPNGQNDDLERLKKQDGSVDIKQIVLHYSNTSQTIGDNLTSVLYIEALHYIRLYCNYYSDSNFEEFNKLLYSGHFDNNRRQRYITYRYCIFDDGEVIEGSPSDDGLEWHSKGLNKSSVGICFITDKTPNIKAIKAAAPIIISYMKKYSIPMENIIGHQEVYKFNSLIEKNYTICPGIEFLDGENGVIGWKHILINEIQNLLI
jgi:hypothetical protein